MNDQITLILADDHAVVRKGLVAFLATALDIDLLEVVTCGAETVVAAKKHVPDVVLLDLFTLDNAALIALIKKVTVSPDSLTIVLATEKIANSALGSLSIALPEISFIEAFSVV